MSATSVPGKARLPQELRLKNIRTPEQANTFLNDHYMAEFNSKFTVPAAETGTAFAPIHRQDLDRIFAIQQERLVGNKTSHIVENRTPLGGTDR